MATVVLKLDVLIASPGDASAGRDAVERAVIQWNEHRGDREGVFLHPVRWEVGAVPMLGEGDAQTVINGQLVNKSDIVIALFYNRMGSATPRAISGTAEEIERSAAAGKPVHVYFSEQPMPHNADLRQLQALRKFRTQIQKLGLIGTFESEAALHDQVVRALDYDIKRVVKIQRAKRQLQPREPYEWPVPEEPPWYDYPLNAWVNAEEFRQSPSLIIINDRNSPTVTDLQVAILHQWDFIAFEGSHTLLPEELDEYALPAGSDFEIPPGNSVEFRILYKVEGRDMHMTWTARIDD